MKRLKSIVLCLALLVLLTGVYLGVLQMTGNFHEVVPGETYRSAQLKKGDLLFYAKKYQIKSVLNLRGADKGKEWYDNEVAESKQANIQHIDFAMSAKKEITSERALELIEIMRQAPKPMLIHCYGGADRTGLASALYISGVKMGTEFDSELQLSLIYGHVPFWFSKGYAMTKTFESLEPFLGYYKS